MRRYKNAEMCDDTNTACQKIQTIKDQTVLAEIKVDPFGSRAQTLLTTWFDADKAEALLRHSYFQTMWSNAVSHLQ